MIEQQILRDKFLEAQKGWRAACMHACFLTVYLLGAAVCFGVAWEGHSLGWMPRPAPWWLLLAPVPVAGLLTWLYSRRLRRRLVVRTLETRMPALNGLLLTAEELLTKPELNVLEQRVISLATDHAASHDWAAVLTHSRGRMLRRLMFFGLLLWIYAFVSMNRQWGSGSHETVAAVTPAKTGTAAEWTAVVTPGDVELEKGSRLVVEARFDSEVPAEASLVVLEPGGAERERIPMQLAVDGQVFGGLISRVDKDARYRVEAGSGKTSDYRITTFVYPVLERSDVKIKPPAYAKLPEKVIKNTLKVTAMAGSDLEFTFKVNKPVKDAELFGEDKTVIPLKASAEDPTVLTGRLKAEKSQKWRLHLVDAQERANKNPPWITIQVLADQLARIEVVFPKRDIQVSSLQELPVEARVWDDLGVTKSGVSFSIASKNKEVTFNHPATLPSKKQEVKELLALEPEEARPRQLISYHFWAEDRGPQGEVRRAMSDMFFAEVRHFEDIFREAEAPPGQPQEKGAADELGDLQKQVVNATWRLIREVGAGRSMDAAKADVEVVHQSQQVVLEKTKEAMEEAEDEQFKTFLTEAWKSMKDALDPLAQASAEKKRTALNQALTFEQSALEWLHQAQSREHRVMRQSQPSSGAQKPGQNQIMTLELKQEKQRYEEEKQASPEQTAQQQENLQVLNRLKELARRQEALAEKMKELQKQMEKAKSEEEKQELASQLKRLQDEQQQLLKDVDDLKERMETPDNAANMAEAREQLEQTREQVLDAAEKLKEQQLADAANSATRAQRELEKMQEDFKTKTAQRFSEEMKQLRQQAREVADRQKKISEGLENQTTPTDSPDTSASLEKMLSGSQAARQIEEQKARVQELLEGMRRISEQAEGNNPLLHRRLYEAVREAQTGGIEENLEEARMQSRYGNRSDAQDAERKAAQAVDQLKQGVEKAAESVLGSETEALRMARSELDKLIDDVRKEAAGGTDASKSPGDEKKTAGEPSAGEGQPDQTRPPGNLAEAGGKNQSAESEGRQGEKPGKGQGAASQPQQADAAGAGEKAASDESKPGKGSGQQADEAGKGPIQVASGAEGEGSKGSPSPAGDSPEKGGTGQGQGQQPGSGAPESSRGSQPQQTAQAGEGQSSPQGQGSPGQNPGGKGMEQGEGQGQGQTGGQAQEQAANGGPQPGSTGQGQHAGGNPGAPSGGSRAQTPSGGGSLSAGTGGGDDRRRSLAGGLADAGSGLFFDEPGTEQPDRGPLTGEGYGPWTERLRNVEELLSQPELRNEAAKVLDNARSFRADHQRNNLAPQADHLEMRITQPLVELRDRVAEELAKRDSGNPMVPVDRDPVPPAFRDLVKRYYKELGNGN